MSNPRRYRSSFTCCPPKPSQQRRRSGLRVGHLFNLAAVTVIAAICLEITTMNDIRTRDLLPSNAQMNGAGYYEPMRHHRRGENWRKPGVGDQPTYRHNKRDRSDARGRA